MDREHTNSRLSILNRRAFYLSCFTVAYNLAEGICSLLAGGMADSSALIGFGFDSFIESLSGAIMIWRFKALERMSPEKEAHLEKKAIRLVGYSFFILGGYVMLESIGTLFSAIPPSPSLFGIIIAVFSLIIMPLLYILKVRTGDEIGSASLVADASQTLACVMLSAALLAGLCLNYLFGFWQADPLTGLIITFYLFKEGREALNKGKLCSC